MLTWTSERASALRRAIACLIVAVGLWIPPDTAGAQVMLSRAVVQARRSCDGDTITTIDIRSHPPVYTGLAAEAQKRFAGIAGFSPVTTRPAVIAAYMRLNSGTACTEIDRSESERLLRAQPFIASASIQAIPDGPHRVRLVVDVVDEPRLIAGAAVRRGTLGSLSLGSDNLSGRGLAIAGRLRNGFAYRDGFGFSAVKYGMFGRPDFLAVVAERRAIIGERLSIEVAEPFLTDLQRRAYHATTSVQSGYTSLVRPDGKDVSLFVRRTAYDIGWVTRLGPNRRGAIGLVGAVLLGEEVRTGDDLVIVSDTGLERQATNPFRAAYPAFTTTRVAAIGGLRALRFITVKRFDALMAEQDMGIGVQLDLLMGPSLQASAGAADIFVSTDLYAGIGDSTSFWVARALAEARKDRATRRWDGVVANGRLAWYGRASGVRSHKLSVEMSAVQHLAFPVQLSFRDADGGLAGFGASPAVGGQRVVARFEERKLLGTFGGRADFAVGLFATAGRLWAGDVPYGGTTPVRASAGISLLGAYPTGGKRTYRLDIAVPFNPERGGPRVEFRLSASDRTRLLWIEPGDVSRARTGAVPVSLMKW